MKNDRIIWKHELRQADQIVKILLDDQKVPVNWRIILLPVYLYHLFKYRNNLRFTRKNVLYTKKLAFEAAKNISQGKDHAWEFRQIEIKTTDVLNKEKKGFYTEKIRRRQLPEIDYLINHYQALFNSKQTTYSAIIKEIFPAKGQYLAHLSSLQKLEEDVLQASITSMRKGTKKDRRQWFEKVRETTKKIRMAEADQIYK
ncbi:hypothetical protein GWN26_00530 [Candidatus Saccharibacteria bacterium]|nr:hypothetical protein [Candidatus Saccharibacteria bacterium]